MNCFNEIQVLIESAGTTDLPAITQLFRAYAASPPIDLGYQGFDGELASLPGKYAPPSQPRTLFLR